MKKIKNFKITFILAISSVAILTAYLFQKPFAASSYADYRPRWNKSQLSSLRDDFENKEKTYPNLKKECDKKINFNGPKPVTDFSFVYVPGFSATRKEIFPVVESLAKQFSANYFLTRFAAHGEAADDFKGYQAQSFFDTLYEAVEIGGRLGKKKVFIGTSTGSAVISAGLVQNLDIDAAVLIAPAYAINISKSWLLSTRLGPLFKILLIDEIIKWTPKNPSMENYWNTSYHRDGAAALMQAVEYIRGLDFSKIKVPVLMLYTQNDDVVLNSAVFEKFSEINDPRKRLVEIPSSDHVLAGEFTSPETTELVIKEIHDWLQGLKL